jgi:pimeloyl-ACP methyl ester carboxylesterase
VRRDIEFRTEDGVSLRGWHYLPESAGATATVVMAHGYSAVKEMYLDRFAEVFAETGIGAVVFDNRNFGASDGEPRQEIAPGSRSGITETRSPGRAAFPRSMPSGSASGAQVTAALMCSWSAPLTGGSSASLLRCR